MPLERLEAQAAEDPSPGNLLALGERLRREGRREESLEIFRRTLAAAVPALAGKGDDEEKKAATLAAAEERIAKAHVAFKLRGMGAPPPAEGPGRVVGFCIDAETGLIPDRAKIIGFRGEKRAYARPAEGGMFELENLEPGMWLVEARGLGYETESAEVNVIPGRGPGMGAWLAAALGAALLFVWGRESRQYFKISAGGAADHFVAGAGRFKDLTLAFTELIPLGLLVLGPFAKAWLVFVALCVFYAALFAYSQVRIFRKLAG